MLCMLIIPFIILHKCSRRTTYSLITSPDSRRMRTFISVSKHDQMSGTFLQLRRSLCVENYFFFRQSDAPHFADNKRGSRRFSQNSVSSVRQNPWQHYWLHKSFHLSILPFWQPGLFYTCPSPRLSHSHLSQSVFLHSLFCILLITWPLCHSPLKSIKLSVLKSRRERGWLIYRRTPASSPSLIKALSGSRRRDTQQGRGLIDIYWGQLLE